MDPLSTERAAELDAMDPLAGFRNEFVIEDDLVYLDGNSLGRLPKEAVTATRNLIEREWAHELVLGWEHWIDQSVAVGNTLAPLIGASRGEVIVCDQTSINLYKAASAALTASGRTGIVTDRGNFPSDRYILEAVANAHNGTITWLDEDPSIDDIARAVTDAVGVVSLSHVAYRSGMMHDGAGVTAAVHEGGASMLWDLAHSTGSVPVSLNDWEADLAVGCTYKYLNGGPGAPGFLYVRSDLQLALEQPIPGWFSHERPFDMADTYVPSSSIRRFAVGTPPMASLVAAAAGIDVAVRASIPALRAKSTALTEYFITGIDSIADAGIDLVTPRNPQRRGSHITIAHDRAYQVSLALRADKIIADFREPNLIRFGFAPLYTSFSEVARALVVLKRIVTDGAFHRFPAERSNVT